MLTASEETPPGAGGGCLGVGVGHAETVWSDVHAGQPPRGALLAISGGAAETETDGVRAAEATEATPLREGSYVFDAVIQCC